MRVEPGDAIAVYGTLRAGQRLHRTYLAAAEWVGYAPVRGVLRRSAWGDWPVLTDGAATAVSEVWRAVSPQALRRLADALTMEHRAGYDVVRETVLACGVGPVEVWICRWAHREAGGVVPFGDWSRQTRWAR